MSGVASKGRSPTRSGTREGRNFVFRPTDHRPPTRPLNRSFLDLLFFDQIPRNTPSTLWVAYSAPISIFTALYLMCT
jgi:hypothetical protein